MSRTNGIIVTAHPKGKMGAGYINFAGKPGMAVQLEGAPDDNGNYLVRPYNRAADGGRPLGPFAVLVEDRQQGKLMTAAYADGDLASYYCPEQGDQLNLLLADVAGTTSDDHAIDEQLMVDDTTGKWLVTTGSPEMNHATLKETITDPTADQLAFCMFNGW